MSVYAELIKAGINEEAASKITEATDIHYRLITSDQFDSKMNDLESRLVNLELKVKGNIAELELRVMRHITVQLWTALGVMTTIYGVFIGLMTWALK